MSESNLATVLRFMKYKQDQISGCRDREESIKPEFLKASLEQALVKNGLDDVLNKAQEEADKGWPCRAWTDHNDKDEAPQHKKSRRKRQRETSSNSSSIMAKAKQHNVDKAFSFSFL